MEYISDSANPNDEGFNFAHTVAVNHFQIIAHPTVSDASAAYSRFENFKNQNSNFKMKIAFHFVENSRSSAADLMGMFVGSDVSAMSSYGTKIIDARVYGCEVAILSYDLDMFSSMNAAFNMNKLMGIMKGFFDDFNCGVHPTITPITETKAPVRVKRADFFVCFASGRYRISIDLRCNGIEDCLYGEDELNCKSKL